MELTLNGTRVDVDAPPMKRLLDVLREDLRLTGTKEGCGEGECGACTVLIDGLPVNSCLVPFAQVRGAEVRTIEGLGGEHPLQRSFVDEGGAQCGICTPGMILAACALPPTSTREDIRVGLAGNLCRCTGYTAIYRAVEVALAEGGLLAAPPSVAAAKKKPRKASGGAARKKATKAAAAAKKKPTKAAAAAKKKPVKAAAVAKKKPAAAAKKKPVKAAAAAKKRPAAVAKKKSAAAAKKKPAAAAKTKVAREARRARGRGR